MGPARRIGWGRRIRTPATRARTWRPTPRRSPTKSAERRHDTTPGRANRQRASAQDGLEAAAGTEAGSACGRDRDLLARARVAAVAGGALGDHEGAEAADGHA